MKLTRLRDIFDPEKKVDGTWKLAQDGQISFVSRNLDEQLRIKFPVIAAEPDALVLSVTESQSDQDRTTGLMRLSGKWSMDAQNRITFDVAKESGRRERLIFGSSWRVNDRNELIYTHEAESLKKRKKVTRQILFKGQWGLSEKNNLVYSLGADSDSRFEIKGAFQTDSIRAREGELRYQAGVGLSKKRRARTLTLFGQWSLSRDLAVDFELETTGARRKITFGAVVGQVSKGEWAFYLTRPGGGPVGLEVRFSKDLPAKNGEWFLRALKNAEESRVEAGVRGRW